MMQTQENEQLLTFVLKLKVAKHQAKLLVATINVVNDARNLLSRFALKHRVFTRTALSKRNYVALRQRLPSSLVIGVIRSVSRVYSSRKQRKSPSPYFFGRTSTIDYNRRGCAISPNAVRIRVLEGWLSLPYECPPQMPSGWEKKWIDAGLVYRRGEFFLRITVPVKCPLPFSPSGILGVDVGMVNPITDSDGTVYIPDKKMIILQKKYARIKRKLQEKAKQKKKCGIRPRSIYRRLKNTEKKEKRIVIGMLHAATKSLIAKAQGTNRAIAIENPKSIGRKRKGGETAGRRQSCSQETWIYKTTLSMVQYKAKLSGVPVITVSPYLTSITCPVCKTAERHNRKNRDWFSCRSCGYSGPSDHVAAINILHRGENALRRPGCLYQPERPDLTRGVGGAIPPT